MFYIGIMKRGSGDREEPKKQASIISWMTTSTCNTKKKKLPTLDKKEERKSGK